jgi:hypothetical protein
MTTTDKHSRASSGASAGSLDQADDATVERYASPAIGAPSAAGKVGHGPSPKSPSVKKTNSAEVPKVEGTAAASEADPWNKYFRGWVSHVWSTDSPMDVPVGMPPDCLVLTRIPLSISPDTAHGT